MIRGRAINLVALGVVPGHLHTRLGADDNADTPP